MIRQDKQEPVWGACPRSLLEGNQEDSTSSPEYCGKSCQAPESYHTACHTYVIIVMLATECELVSLVRIVTTRFLSAHSAVQRASQSDIARNLHRPEPPTPALMLTSTGPQRRAVKPASARNKPT